MSILSSIKTTAKKVATVAKNAVSGLSANYQTSSLGNALTGLTNSIKNAHTAPAPQPLQIYETKSDGNSYGVNNPDIIRGGTTYANAQGGGNPSYNEAIAAKPVTIGKTSTGATGSWDSPTTINSGKTGTASPVYSTSLATTTDNNIAPRLSATSLNANSLSTTPNSVSLPSAPGYNDVGTINNGALIGALSDTSTYDPATNMFGPLQDTGVSTDEQKRAKMQQQLMDMLPQKENVMDSEEVQRQQAEVNRRKQEVANYTGQLNNVVAQQNADLLRTRGDLSNEGGTETVYGGIAATINREAAIKALPIQAQLSAAQGNLGLAQDYLTQLTTWKQQEIDNRYAYKTALYNSISGFVTSEQKIRLDAKIKAEDRAYDMAKMNLSLQDDLAKEAAKSNPAAIAKISALNPNSPSFRADMANILKTTGLDGNGAGGSGGFGTDLQAYAAQYAANGTLPSAAELKLAGISAGQISQAAKELPKASGTLVDVNTGIKSKAISSAQEDGIVALKDLTQKLDNLKATYNNTNLLSSSSARQKFVDESNEIVDLLARARTGAAISASEEAMYKKKIPQLFGITQGSLLANRPSTGNQKISDLKGSLEGKLQTNLRSQGLAIYGYSKVKIGDQEYTVGDIISNGDNKGRVNPDGSITLISD